MQGRYTARRALEAGMLDEVQIAQLPVLLESEIVRVVDTPDAGHIRYRVRR